MTKKGRIQTNFTTIPCFSQLTFTNLQKYTQHTYVEQNQSFHLTIRKMIIEFDEGNIEKYTER